MTKFWTLPRSCTLTAGAVFSTALVCAPVAAQEAPIGIERQGADTVRAGERYEYKLQVENRAEVPLSNVRLREFNPQSEKRKEDGQGERPSPQGPDQNGMNEKTIPYLEAGESKTLTFSGISRKEGTIKSCMTVDYTPAVCTEIEVVKPELALNCSIDKQNQSPVKRQSNAAETTLYACENIDLSCQISNQGSGDTQPTKLNIDLPDGLVLADANADMKVPSIQGGGELMKTLSLRANQSGQYELIPTVKTKTGNAESSALNVNVVQPQLELAVQAPAEEYVSRAVEYMVHLRNIGDVAVPQTKLEIERPESLENVSVSSESMSNEANSYDFGTLAPGATRTVTVKGDAIEAGEASLSATASGYCVAEKGMVKTAAVKLQGVPALVLIAFDERDPVAVGESVTYSIRIKNQGSAPAENVELSGQLGDQFTFAQGGGTSAVSAEGGSLNFTPVKSLAPGETAEWQVKADAKSEGYARFNLEMKSSATKRAIVEQEPTRVIK